MIFIPDQPCTSIFPCESGRQTLAMFVDVAIKIGSDADVQSASLVVGDDIIDIYLGM